MFLAFTASMLGRQDEHSLRPETSVPSGMATILERTDAENDNWMVEQDYESVALELKEIARRLKEEKGGFPLLDQILKDFADLELVEFKVVAGRRFPSAGSSVRFRVRVELGGRGLDGRLMARLGYLEMTGIRSEKKWRFKDAQLSELEKTDAPKFYFTDVTEKAVGHNPSFQKQLSQGVDQWRSTLDAAVGVSLYGHNGLAVGDYDGDGWEDIYICQPAGLPNILYRNNGDGTFTDVSASSGLDILNDTSTALFADLENDGDADLLAVLPDRVLMFRNDGRGRYTLEPDAGLRPSGAGAMLTGAALADYDRDNDLDLYVCSYEFWQPGSNYATPTPYYDATNGPPNFLFRNRGNGTFEEVTAQAGLMQNNNRFSFAAAWGDYDSDGDSDLYVANDFGRNNLYRNDGDGTFSDVAAAAGVEDMGAGMSAAWGDYDNDGDPDLYVGNMWSSAGQRLTHSAEFRKVTSSEEVQRAFQRHARGNSLYRNNGDGTFSDFTLQAGVEMGRWAWSSDFVDLNSDGRLDIYITNGYITGQDTHDL